MILELSWIITSSDIRGTECCVCKERFVREVLEANLITDSDRLHLGEICPECLSMGPGYIENRVKRNLRMNIMLWESQLNAEKRALEESVTGPSYKEYEMLKAGVGGPRYASSEDAQAAHDRGEW